MYCFPVRRREFALTRGFQFVRAVIFTPRRAGVSSSAFATATAALAVDDIHVGTVGAVARDSRGRLAAATSTAA